MFNNLFIYILILVSPVTINSCSNCNSDFRANEPSPRKVDDQSALVYVQEYRHDGTRDERNESFDLIRNKVADLSNPLIVAFVHGWKHNASPANKNLIEFTDFVRGMQNSGLWNGKQTLGIYVGWNGCPQAGDQFFNGPAVDADRIANHQRLMSDMVLLANDISARNGKLILIGHSLGGRMVERSYLAHLLKGHKIPSNQFAVLLNPASSQPVSRKLKRALQSSGYSTPQIVSLVARDDFVVNTIYATHEKLVKLKGSRSDQYNARAAAFDPKEPTHFMDTVAFAKKVLSDPSQSSQDLAEYYNKERIRAGSHRNRSKSMSEQAKKIALQSTSPFLQPILRMPRDQQKAAGEELRRTITTLDSPHRSLRSRSERASYRFHSYQFRSFRINGSKTPYLLTYRNSNQAYQIITVGREIMTGHSQIGPGERLLSGVFEELLVTLVAQKFGD